MDYDKLRKNIFVAFNEVTEEFNKMHSLDLDFTKINNRAKTYGLFTRYERLAKLNIKVIDKQIEKIQDQDKLDLEALANHLIIRDGVRVFLEQLYANKERTFPTNK